jgi:hypothetical protein
MPDSRSPMGEVERVAEAIRGSGGVPWAEATEQVREHYRKAARRGLAALRSDREQVSGEAEVEAIAQALADGAGGCTGGCSNRPCEVDYNDAKRIADSLRASRRERPQNIEDDLAEFAAGWLARDRAEGEPLPVDRERPEGMVQLLEWIERDRRYPGLVRQHVEKAQRLVREQPAGLSGRYRTSIEDAVERLDGGAPGWDVASRLRSVLEAISEDAR